MHSSGFPGLTLIRSAELPDKVDDAVWMTWPREHCLPLQADAYRVEQSGSQWLVRTQATGEVIHTSSMQFRLVDRPVPF